MRDLENNRMKWFALALCLAILIALVANRAITLKRRSVTYADSLSMKSESKNHPAFLPIPGEYLPELGSLEKVAAIWPKLSYPNPSDWLANYHEDKQTVNDLLKNAPKRTKNKSLGIAVQPIRPLQNSTEKMIPLISRYLKITFQCPVKTLSPIDTPKKFYFRKGRQINASLLLDHLVSIRPADVWSTAGLLSYDISTPDMNFVFGLSSLTEGVNLSSSARLADQNPQVTLGRISCTMAHELGHALGMTHCIGWSCMINGSNHLEESESRPRLFCPHCVAKLKALRGLDPLKYYTEAEIFFAEYGMEKGRQLAAAAACALKGK